MRKTVIAVLLIFSLGTAAFLLARIYEARSFPTLLVTTSTDHLAEAVRLLTPLAGPDGADTPAAVDSAHVIAPMLLMTRAEALLQIYAVDDVQLMGRVYVLEAATTDLQMMVLIQHTLTSAQQAQLQEALAIDQELVQRLAGPALQSSSAMLAVLPNATAGALRGATNLFTLLNRLDPIDTSQVINTLAPISHAAALLRVHARDDARLQALSAALEESIGQMQRMVLSQHTLTAQERAPLQQALTLVREARRQVGVTG